MNMLVQELKMTFRSWLSYTIGILVTFLVFAWFFEYFKADAQLLDQLLKNFPPEFKAAFGFADVNLAEIEGYMSFVISYVVLVGAVYGMKQGVSLLSGSHCTEHEVHGVVQFPSGQRFGYDGGHPHSAMLRAHVEFQHWSMPLLHCWQRLSRGAHFPVVVQRSGDELSHPTSAPGTGATVGAVVTPLAPSQPLPMRVV